MKNAPDVLTQKRPLEITFNGNSSKRNNAVDGNDFFGLPHKVKQMFKKHKRITQLYGLFIFTCLLINSYKYK